MASSYEVNSFPAKVEAALATKLSAGAEPDRSENTIVLLNFIDDLLAQDDYATASRLCTELSHASHAPALRMYVQEKEKQVRAAEDARLKASQALVKQKADPRDPDANLALGTYLCFFKERWEAGLPFLARASANELKAAADADLAIAVDSGESLTKAGDAWDGLVEKANAGAQPAIRKHAVSEYERALDSPDVTGLSRTRLEQHIEALKSPTREWISKSAKYSLSSSYPDFPPLPYLLDGTEGQWREGLFAFHTKSQLEPYIVVDLGGPCLVSSFEIVNRKDRDQDRAKNLTVWVSADSTGPWREEWQASTVEKEWVVTMDRPVVCRYVKIGLPETSALHLYQVKMFGRKLF